MKYATPAAFRTALEHRLKDEHERTGIPLVRLRKTVAFDRLLARLLEVAPGRWVLKGAHALDLRLGIGTRTTKDIDIGRRDSEQQATEDFIAAQSVDVDDFFSFEIERTGRLDEAPGLDTTRYSVRAELAGRLWEQFPIDVAFSDPLQWDPDRLPGSNLLEFASIPTIEVPVVPLAQHVAEKLHAYTGTFGETGEESSRVKDLVDLVLIREASNLEASALDEALRTTFESRQRQPLPRAMPAPPDDWARPYARLAKDVGIDEDFAAGYAAAAELLDPILAGSARGTWDPTRHAWVDD